MFRIRFYTPKGPPKHVLKNFSIEETLKIDFENPSVLLPILAGSLLLLLNGSLLWLLPFQRFFAHLSSSHSPVSELSAVFPRSEQFLEFTESQRARKIAETLG